MKFLDLIRMSSGNLWRRKLRTFLTVLGVVIGTASIVVMVSLGLALNKSTLDSIEKNGGLTTISVTTGGFENVMFYSSGGDEESDSTKNLITDATVEAIKGIEHVTIASPVLNSNVFAKQGRYTGDLYNVKAMSWEALDKMGLEFAEGGLPQKGSSEVQFIYGNAVILNFYTGQWNDYSYWQTQELPDVDLMKPMYYYLSWEEYERATYPDMVWGDSPEEDTQTTSSPPKKYRLKTAGVIAGSVEDYGETANTVYCDIEPYLALMKRAYRNKAIPGQPVSKSGKPYKTIYYDEVHVRVDDMDNMKGVQKQIKEMGYQAPSVADDIEEQQKSYRMIQLVLGSIGAISLLVAAIGIANTMMMSIYERTKEIGVIKVLGCNLSNIRTMFLMEAAFIGFIGGALGLLLSYGLSAILNHVGSSFLGDFVLMMNTSEGVASYIPLWLAVAALIFAMLVGMIAGFFPALRAMRLSPLAAIRTE